MKEDSVRQFNPSTKSRSRCLSRREHLSALLYTMLNPNSQRLPARIFKVVITTTILVNLVLFILSTSPDYQQEYEGWFKIFEGIASSIFLVEYLARMTVVVRSKRYSHMPPWKARLHYACTFPAIIDLMSCLPFFLEFPLDRDLPQLTYLRLLRLTRILKTQGTIRAVDAVYRVIYYNSEILYVACMVCVFLVFVTAILLYYFRPQLHGHEAQAVPDEFKSISSTLYLAAQLLTGGGGLSSDVVLPWYTKAVLLLTSVFSVAMFAIPASMLTWGFEAEAERLAKRARQKRVAQQRQRRHLQKEREERGESGATSSSLSFLSSTSSSTSSSSAYSNTAWFDDSDYSTDEEYFKIIAGDDGEEEGIDEKLRQQFQNADQNADGTLSLREFQATIQQQHRGLEQDSSRTTALREAELESLRQRMEKIERQVTECNSKLDKIIEKLVNQ